MGGPESDYSVCPRPFLRPGQDRDRTGTGMGQGRDGELDNNESENIVLMD